MSLRKRGLTVDTIAANASHATSPESSSVKSPWSAEKASKSGSKSLRGKASFMNLLSLGTKQNSASPTLSRSGTPSSEGHVSPSDMRQLADLRIPTTEHVRRSSIHSNSDLCSVSACSDTTIKPGKRDAQDVARCEDQHTDSSYSSSDGTETRMGRYGNLKDLNREVTRSQFERNNSWSPRSKERLKCSTEAEGATLKTSSTSKSTALFRRSPLPSSPGASQAPSSPSSIYSTDVILTPNSDMGIRSSKSSSPIKTPTTASSSLGQSQWSSFDSITSSHSSSSKKSWKTGDVEAMIEEERRRRLLRFDAYTEIKVLTSPSHRLCPHTPISRILIYDCPVLRSPPQNRYLDHLPPSRHEHSAASPSPPASLDVSKPLVRNMRGPLLDLQPPLLLSSLGRLSPPERQQKPFTRAESRCRSPEKEYRAVVRHRTGRVDICAVHRTGL